MSSLASRFPATATYDERQLARTAEDVGYSVDFLAAALYVDDPGLFVDFVGWLVDILAPRGVPAQTVLLCLDALHDLVGATPRAQAYVSAARVSHQPSAAAPPRV